MAFYHKIQNLKRALKKNFLELLFPKRCLSCQKFLKEENKLFLCSDCLQKIELNNGLFCPVCKKRLFLINIKNSSLKKITRCYHKNNYLYALASATSYQLEVIQKIIYAFKYQFLKDLSYLLASLTYLYLERNQILEFITSNHFLMMPVPLFRKKENFRGFNQAALFGKILAQKLKLEFSEKLLIQKRSTKDQTGLSFNERKLNVKDAFLLLNPEKIKKRNIILIDDVYTTGATLQEIALLLKKSQAQKILGLTFAISHSD